MSPCELPDRFRRKFKIDKSGCWLWTGSLNFKGYGAFWIPELKTTRGAHRFAYEYLVGPVPEGLQIDHLCRVRHCVNPAHMEPVTCRENLMRGETIAARNAAATHCIHGHQLTIGNTKILPGGRRECRKCRLEWNKKKC